MVPINIIDHDGHAVSAGAEARGRHQVVVGRGRMHPDHTVADVQLAVHHSASFVASDGSRPEAEHRNQMIMDSFDVVIDEQGQSLRQSMIDLGHLVEDVQQFLIAGTAGGESRTVIMRSRWRPMAAIR